MLRQLQICTCTSLKRTYVRRDIFLKKKSWLSASRDFSLIRSRLHFPLLNETCIPLYLSRMPNVPRTYRACSIWHLPRETRSTYVYLGSKRTIIQHCVIKSRVRLSAWEITRRGYDTHPRPGKKRMNIEMKLPYYYLY